MPYARNWRGAAPPFPDVVTVPTIFSSFPISQHRTHRFWTRRGKQFFPIQEQDDAIVEHRNGRTKIGLRQWQRRGKGWLPTPPQIGVPNPVIVLSGTWAQRRTKDVWQRSKKSHAPAPPWFQADVWTNQPYFVFPRGQRVRQELRQWRRKGRLWLPTPPQEQPPYLSKKAQRVTDRYWLKRSKRPWVIPPQEAYALNPAIVLPWGQRRTKDIWQRSKHSHAPAPPWFQADPLTSGYLLPRISRRPVLGLRSWQKRGKLWLPVQDVGPKPLDNQARRTRPERITPYFRRGHIYWILPVPPPVPKIVSSLHSQRRRKDIWLRGKAHRIINIRYVDDVTPIIVISGVAKYFADDELMSLFLASEKLISDYLADDTNATS
jgi:hypothetical protein